MNTQQTTMKILIVGATGPVGLGRIICQLTAQQHPQSQIKVLVRRQSQPNPERQAILDQLRSYGAQLVEGDLKDPDSLLHACEGIDSVITTATSITGQNPEDTIETVDRAGQINLVNAAKAQGVSHFIYTSMSPNIQRQADCAFTSAKQAVEQQLKNSGLNYTILRPSFFAECWLCPGVSFDTTQKTAQLFGDAQAKINFIAIEDVAQFAVAALSHTGANNATLTLGGPQAIAPIELVEVYQNAEDAKYQITYTSLAMLQEGYKAATDGLAKTFTALSIALALGDEIDMTQTLKQFEHITLQPIKPLIERLINAH